MKTARLATMQFPIRLTLGLVLLGSACATPPPEPQPEFEPALASYTDGTIRPEVLLPVGESIPQVQFFAPEGAEFHDLQLLVATAKEVPDAPLMVEIRNPDLDRRYGHGMVEIAQADPGAQWRTVRWEVSPQLEPEGKYAIVLFSEAEVPRWQIAVGAGEIYPWGELMTRSRLERRVMGFRARYSDGSITQSELAAGEKDVEVDFDLPVAKSPYGIPILNTSKTGFTQREEPMLPQCVGSRCADFTKTLLDDAAERKRVAKQEFEVCVDSSADSLKMKKPVVGISCRDVCSAHGYEGCIGLQQNRSYCQPLTRTGRSYGSSSGCDAVVSSGGDPDEVSCLCSEVEVHTTALTSPEAVRKMVRENYKVGSRGPELEEDAIPSGITCSQVCCELLGEECEGAAEGRLVTPTRADCRCGKRETGMEFRRNSHVVGDKIVATYRGKAWLIDPATATMQSFEGVPVYGARPEVTGAFVIWRVRGDREKRWVLDTNAKKVLEIEPSGTAGSRCDYVGNSRSLALICRKDQKYAIIPQVPEGRTIYTPKVERTDEVLSFDGKVLEIEAQNRLDKHVWKVGEREWKKVSRGPQKGLEPGFRAAAILSKLFEVNPNSEGFVDGVFYDVDSDGLWSFDTRDGKFRRWPRRGYRGRISTEDGVVRVGEHILNPQTKKLHDVDAYPLRALGKYMILDTAKCPTDQKCRQLPAPFDSKSVLEVDPTELESEHPIEPELVEVSAP